MFSQVTDFRDECAALHALMQPLKAADYTRPTRFKQWTFNDILGHLHIWNHAANLTLQDSAAFQVYITSALEGISTGSLRTFENQWLGDISGPALLDRWHGAVAELCTHYAAADPRARVIWAGPDMSVRSCITARLMETWAHAQAIYDQLGVERQDTDRIRNIAQLGINTYGWTFANRGIEIPQPMPCVRLTAPSGAIWEWGEPSDSDCIEGSATGFCQTVTQTRNVADTDLRTRGIIAGEWMRLAQCFAGPPQDPPAPGTRFIAT